VNSFRNRDNDYTHTHTNARLRYCCVARLRDCCVARLRDCCVARLRDCCKVARLRDCCVARLRDCCVTITPLSSLTFQSKSSIMSNGKIPRPTSLYSNSGCEDLTVGYRPQRPTSLFKTPLAATSSYITQSLITPTGDPQKRLLVSHHQRQQQQPPICRRFDSLSELGLPSSSASSGGGHSAMIRPNCLTRRTSYRYV
jgi:hypothetical protein